MESTSLSEDYWRSFFSSVMDLSVTGVIKVDTHGVLAGTAGLKEKAEQIGLDVAFTMDEGSLMSPGETVMLFTGSPKQILLAEEILIGEIAKASGIATVARRLAKRTSEKTIIVSGVWNKIPLQNKKLVHNAILASECMIHICSHSIVCLGKNHVRIFGGVTQLLSAAQSFTDKKIFFHIGADTQNLESKVEEAIAGGAHVVVIDTDRLEDVDKLLDRLQNMGVRDKIKLAIGGNIKVSDIPEINKKDIDIIDFGKVIVDAPALDFLFDVINVNHNAKAGQTFELLEKTELWVEDIYLYKANLAVIAENTADVLSIDKDKVLVVDVREGLLTMDILSPTLKAENIISKEKELLERLKATKGVTLGADVRVHSNGILGLISLPEDIASQTLENIANMSKTIKDIVSKRLKVFPTGSEVIKGLIMDTNSPLIKDRFTKAGYQVDVGNALADNTKAIARGLFDAACEGYGLIITTGGVGAEDKDFTIEAVLELDPESSTPWIVKYTKGQGRHKKEGVRIAVGKINDVIIIALPGPTDEVASVIDVIIEEMQNCSCKDRLAYRIVGKLTTVLKKNIVAHKAK